MKITDLSKGALRMLNENKTTKIKVGDWVADCYHKRFKVNNNGIKLWAKEDENLEQVIFDTEKKTVSVKVKTPTLSDKAPRTLDLSNDVEFFEALRKNIEELLTQEKGKYTSVIPNEDRTIFEIKG